MIKMLHFSNIPSLKRYHQRNLSYPENNPKFLSNLKDCKHTNFVCAPDN